ncbi:hypothetical protein ACRHK7_06975 [Weissella tructae]|uniref:Uncharacterized protein n=2 Tax=Weissella TaxID=46255 RepID=A0A075TZ16_9LACO|nr:MULTISPECIES: hypothetical protein [Weissella]AIG65435.1 hypothetical protein WS08_0496 [Weissella tructae]AIM62749.1 hypothetical protein WS74_0497 [Weissella ceti]AIM64084.1 hypothetical protein WS105_0494 [Weissella ceti]ELA07105.1 hypothetical protein WCNC_05977 [Weissella ceti NC36]QVV91811.1 hypothetical protein KHQ32_02745 [Weissella tructae]
MAEQRPIVYFQRLMGNYDRQVAEIMKAKREYLVFADDEEIIEEAPVVMSEPVIVEVLVPKQMATPFKTPTIVELNAPLDEAEVLDTEMSVTEAEDMHQDMMEQPVVEPIVMTPTHHEEPKAVSTSMPEATPKVEEKKVEETPKAKPMTGLGLNLDSIFNEEFSAEQTGYFGK